MTGSQYKPFEGASVVSPTSAGLFLAVGLLLAIFTLNDILEFSTHNDLRNVLFEGFMSALFLLTGVSIITRLKSKTKD
jgi:hypothetical protein